MEEIPEESGIRRFLRKTYLVIIAFFLILVLVSSTSLGHHFFYYISGQIVSSTMSDYTFSLENGKVEFDPATFEELRSHYLDNQDVEIKVCLTGQKQDQTYSVQDMYVPPIYHQDVHSVTSGMCNESTIISLHSHPYMRCLFSQQDILSYEAFKQVNPQGIIALMCDQERFTFYGYK